MPSTFFKAEHVGFNHYIALPCEYVAVFRQRPANLAASGRPAKPQPDVYPPAGAPSKCPPKEPIEEGEAVAELLQRPGRFRGARRLRELGRYPRHQRSEVPVWIRAQIPTSILQRGHF
jgi:hypothetical protein